MSKELFLNGINASTGFPIEDFPVTTEIIARVARGQMLSSKELRDVRIRRAIDRGKRNHLGVSEGIEDQDLSQTGWGIIFPSSLPLNSVGAIKDALKPLLDLRKKQATTNTEQYYREYYGQEGVRNGESKIDFLMRFGIGPGSANPQKGMPYYLMLIGSPELIPFSFQFQLDIQYAVGRIYFEKLEDYYNYARSVVLAETNKSERGKKVALFGVGNNDDIATALTVAKLVTPLSIKLNKSCSDWEIKTIAPDNATKANLHNFLGGKETPALLFTASHGLKFELDDNRLFRHTGALLCQDWPGRNGNIPICEDMYFSADDISINDDVFGMIAFIFACFGGGIPKTDNFYHQVFGRPRVIAPKAFISSLPLRLLSHPKGGALGVFAHIDRAWTTSFDWDGSINDTTTFESTIEALLNGKTAGAATEYFNERYGEIAAALNEELELSTLNNQDDVKIAGLWTSNNDARNYSFIGDPAVRLIF